MKCPNCGNEVRGNFCTNCGTRVDEASTRLPGEGAAGDLGATSVLRPGDLEGIHAPQDAGQGAYAQSPPEYAAPPPQQAYAPPPADQQPYAPPPPASQQPSATPPPSYQAPPPASGGSNWARELGIGSTTPGASAGARAAFPGGFSVPVPPGVQNALAPLEQFGKQIVAWVGSVVLLIGLFVSSKTWTASFGIVSGSASRSLWDWATFWAVILLILVIISAALAYIRDYKWLLLTGAASLVILIIQFLWTFSSGYSISGVSAHPSWGWILLFPGALLILAAGAMRPTPRDRQDDAGVMRLIGQARSRTGASS